MDAIKDLTKIGYEILRTLGEGSYGKVVLAEDKRQRKVAIKIIDKKSFSQEYCAKDLPQELAVIRTARHPHIINVHKIMMRYGFVYIVMDSAATDLYRAMKRGPIHPTRVKRLFSQLLSAVAYLHKQDIVHRDLKPDNVLLTADDQVKLTDFSLSRFSRGKRKSRSYCCTPAYGAPEIIRREPYDPKKSDVYSLGVILFEMLTGRQHQKAAGEAEKFPRRIKKSARDLVLLMLTDDPEARPSAEELTKHTLLQMDQGRSSSVGKSVVKALPISRKVDGAAGQKQVAAVGAEGVEDQAYCGPSTSSGLHYGQNNISEQKRTGSLDWLIVVRLGDLSINSDELEGPSRKPFLKEVTPLKPINEEPQCSSSEEDAPQDVPEPEVGSSSMQGRGVEVAKEEGGCSSCSRFSAAVKRAARALRRKVKKFFRVGSAVHNSSPSS